MNDTAVFH